MGFFSNLFSRKEINNKFTEGDVIYTFVDSEYALYKILKVDNTFNTYHILSYKRMGKLPDKNNLNELKVNYYHTEVDQDMFKESKLLRLPTMIGLKNGKTHVGKHVIFCYFFIDENINQNYAYLQMNFLV